jgi:hypothetical protein
VPKRIPCRVIQTKVYYSTGDLLVTKPWPEPSNLYLSVPTVLGTPYGEPSFTNKNFGNIGKLFNDLIRETGILDYYA